MLTKQNYASLSFLIAVFIKHTLHHGCFSTPHAQRERGKVIGCGVPIYTRIMVTIKKRAGVIPYSFSSSIALLSSLLSCSFYLLDLRTISSVDILEMT